MCTNLFIFLAKLSKRVVIHIPCFPKNKPYPQNKSYLKPRPATRPAILSSCLQCCSHEARRGGGRAVPCALHWLTSWPPQLAHPHPDTCCATTVLTAMCIRSPCGCRPTSSACSRPQRSRRPSADIDLKMLLFCQKDFQWYLSSVPKSSSQSFFKFIKRLIVLN